MKKELCKKAPDKRHCWHQAGYIEYPNKVQMICCWCGKTYEHEYESISFSVSTGEHGKYWKLVCY